MSDEMPAWAREMQNLLLGRLDGIEGRFEGRLDGIDVRLGGLKGRLDGFESRLGAIEARISTLATRDELSRVRADIMERIDRLQEDLTRQTEEGTVNYNMAATAAGRLVSLEETVISLTRLVRRVQSRLDDLEGKQQGH